jgi:phospholipase C
MRELPRMLKRLIAIALGLFALVLAACGGGGKSTPTIAKSTAPPVLGNPYHHIVVVIQENRSFDNMFAGAKLTRVLTPDVETTLTGYNNVCGDSQNVTTCTPVPLVPTGFESGFDPDHSHASLVEECNTKQPTPVPTGTTSPCLMNGFQSAHGDGPQTYAFLPPAEIMPYVRLANSYGIADHFFSPGLAPSFPGHVFLVAGLGPADDPNSSPWGCYEPPTDHALLFNGQAPWPCYSLPSIASELDSANVTWKYYTGEGENPPAGWDGLVIGYAAISSIFNSAEYQAKVVPRSQFFTDAVQNNQCTLPNVSWITPNGNASDHPSFDDSADGPYWVATIYETIAQSPCYADTAMIVLWDDSGGWYDHVPPPYVLTSPPPGFAGYRDIVVGMRVPLIFIAPNAVANVSKTPRDFGAVLAFIEKNYGLNTLGGEDLDFGGDALGDMWQANPTATISPIPRSSLMSGARRPYSVKYFLSQPAEPADNE